MSGVKGKSGRKAKSHDAAEVQKTMTEAAVSGVKILRNYIRGLDSKGNKVSITAVKLKAIELAIAHAVGLPRQKVDVHHTGDQLTLKDLAHLASEADTIPTIELPKETIQTSKN